MECVTGVPRMSQHPCGKPSAEPRSAKGESDWNAFPLPTRTAEVTSVAVDPFDVNRIYFGTLREGLFVFEGTAQKYEAKKSAESASVGGGGGSWRVVVESCDDSENTFVAIDVRAAGRQAAVSALDRYVLVDGAIAPVDRGREVAARRGGVGVAERRRGRSRRGFLSGEVGKRRWR